VSRVAVDRLVVPPPVHHILLGLRQLRPARLDNRRIYDLYPLMAS
jgi:hypothetical protein